VREPARTQAPVRTLHVEAASDGTVGGSFRSLHDLVIGLPERGVDPTVVFYQENPFKQALESSGIPVIVWEKQRSIELDGFRDPRIRIRMRMAWEAVHRRRLLLKRLGVDLVHLNNSPYTGYSDWLPACLLSRIPCITSMRGDASSVPSTHQRLLMSGYKRIIPVSEYVGSSPTCAAVRPGITEVIHNGLALERVKQARLGESARIGVRARLGVPPGDGFLAVMAGTIRGWKGQLEVVRAVKHLTAPHRSRIKVILAGGWGPSDERYVSEVRSLIEQCELGGCVELLGHRDDVPELFAAADVAIHASIEPEPFGLVVLEALAAGTPVLAASAGGAAEILREGGGLLHDPSNPEQLAILLARLIDRPEELARLSGETRETAERFSIDRTRDAVVKVYRSVL
jgi:glycosyltransferase involved in cell wall biosynthesis